MLTREYPCYLTLNQINFFFSPQDTGIGEELNIVDDLMERHKELKELFFYDDANGNKSSAFDDTEKVLLILDNDYYPGTIFWTHETCLTFPKNGLSFATALDVQLKFRFRRRTVLIEAEEEKTVHSFSSYIVFNVTKN